MRITTEQRTRFNEMRGTAPAYRVVTDVEGWPIILGRLGRIEYHDGAELAVFTDRKRLIPRLAALPGVRRHQTGDDEARFLFEPESLPQVARTIRAKKRRVMSPEQARSLGAKTAYSSTSVTQV